MRCNATAFAKMYEAIYVDLYKFALFMMKNPQEAEDAVSEAVLTAYEKIGQLREKSAFKGWMFTILSNICKRKLKTKETVVPLNIETEDTLAAEPERAKTPDYGVSVDLMNAIKVLTEEEQDIIIWSVFAGYNSSEISEILKIPPGTVRSKRSRALARMREVLDHYSD